MIRCLLPIVLICAAAGVAHGQEQPNLVRNGDFENVTPEATMPSWRVTTLGEVGFFHGDVLKRPRTGKYALVLVSEQTPAILIVYSDVLPLREAEELEISFFYRTVGDPGAGVAFGAVEGEFTGLDSWTPFVQLQTHNLPPTKDWQPAYWRVRRSELSRQCILMFRLRGEGQFYVDDVRAVVPRAQATCEVAVAGDVVQPPQRRLVRLRLNEPAEGATATAAIVPTAGRPLQARARFDARGQADLTYSLDPSEAHEVRATVVARDGKTVLYGTTLWPSPALDVHVVRPAFRGNVLSTMSPPTIGVRCQVNALPEAGGPFDVRVALREDLKDAREAASATGTVAGGEAVDLDLGPPPPRGNYRLTATASQGGRTLWQTEQLIRVLEPRRWEMSYGGDMVARVNGDPVFPIGLGNVFRRDALPEVAAGGFTFVTAPRASVSDSYLTDAHAVGLRVAASAIQTSLSLWQNLLETCMANPGLLGWYALERPEARELAPAVAQQLYTDLAIVDPYHPVLVSVGDDDLIARYGEACDILLVAPTPVPAWSLGQVGDYVDAARRIVRDRKPVWASIQTAGFAAYSRRPTTERLSRPPSPEEMRCMVFLALIHGARGICFETYELMSGGAVAGFSLPRDCPDLWQATMDTAKQLRELEPLLVGPFPPRASADDETVQAAVFGGEGRRVLIAVNAEPKAVETTIRLPAGVAGTPRVPAGARPVVAAEPGAVRDRFLPLEVRIYDLRG
jgi:hypothetical protein